ncbi:MAG: DEAD/DEAH box helicase [Persephonella sp.]|nr:MAG: DEAD/DEAH box helicase [Persephonella sp.]
MLSLIYFLERNKVAYRKVIPPREAVFKEIKFSNRKLAKYLESKNIKLYSHQVEAIKNILSGKDTVITTATASGKSYIYIFSILERLYKAPNMKSIIVFPLKALARDQYGRIMDIILDTGIDATVDIYNGDTPKNRRREIRNSPPNFLITTPDMLNLGILPYHRNWSDYFQNLDFVVLDEIHAYRGILGSHIGNIIKRLKRITKYYTGKKPTFIMNSATIHNPPAFASKLIGEDKKNIIEISKSGASSPEREIIILKDTVSRETAEFLALTILEDISTIVFVDSRKEAEILALRVKNILKEKDRWDLLDKVSSYRSGYTPEERREIEFKLKTKNILCVISTSALEMGIDIGDIENCYLVGYPGTLAQLWQRFGRAGRRDRKAFNILAPKKNALDQYFVKNPEEIFKRQMEEPIINPENKFILKKHLPVMAKELPIKINELSKIEKDVAKELILENKLGYSNGYLYCKKYKPFGIRSAGDSFTIVDMFTGKVIGDISEDILIYEAHIGAIYIHNGEKYLVRKLDFPNKTVLVEKTEIEYITEPIKESFIDILEIEESKKVGNLELFKGKVSVQTSVIGFNSKDIETAKILHSEIFTEDMILSREFETVAFWWTMPREWEEEIIDKNLKHNIRLLKNFINRFDEFIYRDFVIENLNKLKKLFSSEIFEKVVLAIQSLLTKLNDREKDTVKTYLERIRERKEAFIGGLHGVEHGLIGIYPLFAMNDRWDIGGLSTPFYPQFGKPTIFIYDGYEGGVGYSEVGFYKLEQMIESTYKNIAKCRCVAGCPSCIYSPKCGNSNDFLDKTASIILASKIFKELKNSTF